MSEKEIINAAKNRFDSQLHTAEYKKIHSDDEQLDQLINLVDIKSGKQYLDIGTGNGYVAFSLAKRFPNIHVWGLDIASDSIVQNNKIRESEKIRNINFKPYDGMEFPFDNESFYGSISRYAFHHFPNIERSISEIKRVLEPGGFFVLSDPRTYDDDVDFVDQFQMKLNDGHVHFYKRAEIESHFRKHDFRIEQEFESFVRYPRIMSGDYEELFKSANSRMLEKYKIEFEAEKVYITVSAMNVLFRKR